MEVTVYVNERCLQNVLTEFRSDSKHGHYYFFIIRMSFGALSLFFFICHIFSENEVGIKLLSSSYQSLVCLIRTYNWTIPGYGVKQQTKKQSSTKELCFSIIDAYDDAKTCTRDWFQMKYYLLV